MASTASTQAVSEATTEARRSTPARSARPYFVLGAMFAVGAVGYGIVTWLSHGKESTDDAQVEADAITVSARVQGVVRKVSVSDNQPVKKGDALVELDPADLAARAKQAEAELAAARAQAKEADAQVRIVEAMSKGGLSAARAQLSGTATSAASAEAQIQAAKAALVRAEAEAARANTDFARAESLRKDEAIPQAQVDTARANAEAARAAVAQAEAQLAAARDVKRTAQTQIAEAEGRVEQSAPIEAQLDAARANAQLAVARAEAADSALVLAKLQLDYTRIESPTDGRLGRLAVRVGQLVQAGQAVVVVVPSATYAVANFKETQVGRMHPGQPATITIDAFPGRTLQGRVESTSPGTGARFSLLPADNASGNFVKVVQRLPVKIDWVNLPGDITLAAGMSADVTVDIR